MIQQLDPLLTPRQTANLLDMNPHTIAQWVTRGKGRIPITKKNGKKGFLLSDVQKYYEEKTLTSKKGES